MPNRYKYKGEPLITSIAEKLILTLFAGVPSLKREYIEGGITEFHKSQGGLENPNFLIVTAMANLERKVFAERAEQLGKGYWSILPIYDDNES